MVYLFYTTYISVDLAYHEVFSAKVGKGGICLFDLILYVHSTIFQLCVNGSSWVEPVLS